MRWEETNADGPILELAVDCEHKSGKAFAWCMDIRKRASMWTVERTMRVNDAEGQRVLVELDVVQCSSSRELARQLPSLVKALVATAGQMDSAAI